MKSFGLAGLVLVMGVSSAFGSGVEPLLSAKPSLDAPSGSASVLVLLGCTPALAEREAFLVYDLIKTLKKNLKNYAEGNIRITSITGEQEVKTDESREFGEVRMRLKFCPSDSSYLKALDVVEQWKKADKAETQFVLLVGDGRDLHEESLNKTQSANRSLELAAQMNPAVLEKVKALDTPNFYFTFVRLQPRNSQTPLYRDRIAHRSKGFLSGQSGIKDYHDHADLFTDAFFQKEMLPRKNWIFAEAADAVASEKNNTLAAQIKRRIEFTHSKGFRGKWLKRPQYDPKSRK
jgi:hypothetical protein